MKNKTIINYYISADKYCIYKHVINCYYVYTYSADKFDNLAYEYIKYLKLKML